MILCNVLCYSVQFVMIICAGMTTTETPRVNADISVTAQIIGDSNHDEVGAPDKTVYFIPVCDAAHKPRVGQRFPSFEAAERFYEEYAGRVGFDTKHCTSKKD